MRLTHRPLETTNTRQLEQPGIARSVLLWLLAVAIVATGCGVSGDSGAPTPTATGTSIQGRADAGGPFQSATVKAFKVTALGSKDTSATGQLASGTTDARGNFSLTVPTGETYTGQVLLEVSGTFANPVPSGAACPASSFLDSGPLLSLIPQFVPGVNITRANITPLTHLATLNAQRLATEAGSITSAIVQESYRQVASALGLTDVAALGGLAVLNSDPIDAGIGPRTGATDDEIKYGLLLAGLAQKANDLSVNLRDLVERIGLDIVADGLLDGDPATLTTCSGGTVNYGQATVSSELAAAIDSFVASGFNKSNITSGDPRKQELTAHTSNTNPPIAVITIESQNPTVASTVVVNGALSSASTTDTILTYRWTVTRGQVSYTVTNGDKVQASFFADEAGTYTITLVVSDGRNTATDTETLTIGQVTTTTLSVATPTLQPSSVQAGNSFSATFVVSNNGTIAATGVTPSLVFSRAGSDASTDVLVGTFSPQTANIAAGLTQTFTVTVQVKSGTLPGTIQVAGRAAANNAPTATSNAAPLTVTSPPPTTTTLTIASFDITPTSTSPGNSFVARLSVRNSGQITATAVIPAFSFTRGSSNASADFIVGTTNPPSASIPTAGVVTFTVAVVIRNNTTTGTVQVGASAQGSNTNLAQATPATLTIVPVPAATLVAESVSFSPQATGAGGSFQATFTVRNSSANPAFSVAASFRFTRNSSDVSSEFAVGSITPGAASMDPGTRTTFVAQVSVLPGASAGQVTIAASAKGSNTTTATTSGAFAVSTPGALTLTALSSPRTRLSTGQSLSVTATLRNDGQGTARVSAVGFPAGFPGTNATGFSGSTNISSNATAAFNLTASAPSVPGNFSLTTVTVSATDTLSSRAIGLTSNAAAALQFVIVARPALTIASASFTSTQPTTGTTFGARVPVTNQGPGTVQVATPILDFGADLTVATSGVAPASIASGATAFFDYTVTVSGTANPGARLGTFQLTATADTSFTFVAGPVAIGTVTVNQASQVSRFTLPTNSSELALTADGTKLLAANPRNNTVSLFTVSGSTLTKTTDIAVGSEPTFVAVNPAGTRAYVSNRVSGTVSVIDTASRAVSATLTVGGEPCGIAVSPNGTRAYVANSTGNSVSVLDISVRPEVVTTTVDLPANEFFPFAVAVTNDGDTSDADEKVYVTQFFAQLAPGTDTGPGGDADNGRIGRVSVLDSSSNTFVSTVTLNSHDSGFLSTGTLAATTGTPAFPNFLSSIVIRGNKGYVTNTAMSPAGPVDFRANTQAFISVFSTASDQEVTTNTFNLNRFVEESKAVQSGKFFMNTPWALGFSGTTTAAYVLSAASDVAMRVRFSDDGTPLVTGTTGGSAAALTQLDVGKNPRGIAFNAAGTLAYVFNHVGRDVTVIDAATNTVIATAQAGTLPATGTEAARIHRGEELFNTSRGRSSVATAPANRMSAGGWGSCFSCHAFGWTDTVVWQFAAGPRKATPLNATFSKVNSTHQRILNWSAIFDEVEDFELNIRTVSSSGAATAATTSRQGLMIGVSRTNPPGPDVIASFSPKNDGRGQDGGADWNAIEAFFKSIRSPVSARADSDSDVQAGRVLFQTAGCVACHGGDGWTSSRLLYSPPPPSGVASQPAAAPLQVTEVLRQSNTFVSGELRSGNTAAQGSNGFNPPSLLGAWAFPPFFHNGRARTLEEVFTRQINGQTHQAVSSNGAAITTANLPQLIAFLESIDESTPHFTGIAQLRYGALIASSPISRSSTATFTVTVSNDSDCNTATVTSATLTFDGSTPITATSNNVTPTLIAAGQTVTFSFAVTVPSTATTGNQNAKLNLSFTDTLTARTISRTVGTVNVQTDPSLTAGTALLDGKGSAKDGAFVERSSGGAATSAFTWTISNATGSATAVPTGITATFTSTDGMIATLGSDGGEIAAGGTGSISFTIGATLGATLADNAVSITATYRDKNQPSTATTGRTTVTTSLGFAVVDPPLLSSAVTFVSTVSQGEASIPLSFTLANGLNRAPASIASAPAITFTTSGGSATARYTVGSISPTFPVTLAAGDLLTFQTTVSAGAAAPTTRTTLTLTATGSDVKTAATTTTSDTADFDVVAARPVLVISTLAPATSVLSTGNSTSVTLFVQNRGSVSANATSPATLTFANGATDVSTAFSISQTPAVTSYAANATTSVRFTITLTDTASGLAIGTISVGALVSATSTPGNTDVSETDSNVGTIETKGRPALDILSIAPDQAQVSTGQTFLVTMVIANSGIEGATVTTAPALAFRNGSTDVSSQFATSQQGTVTTIPAGGQAVATFSVTPSALATPGTITLGGSIGARSTSDASVTVTTSTTNAGSFTLQGAATSASISFSGTNPTGVDGEPLTTPVAIFSMQFVNPTGNATLNVSTGSIGFEFNGVSIDSTFRVTPPAFPFNVAGGVTATFNFPVVALEAAPRAVSLTATFLATGSDSNSGETTTFQDTGTFFVRDAAARALPSTHLTTDQGGTDEDLFLSPASFFTDGTRLFVADSGNNRVLIYASTSDTTPTTIIGQPDATSGGPNAGTGGVEGGLNNPQGIFVITTGTNATSDSLLVADTGNSRVLIYSDVSNLTTFTTVAASIVYGQDDMTENSENKGGSTTAGSLSFPSSVCVTGGIQADIGNPALLRVVVADTGNNRVVVYDGEGTNASTVAFPPTSSAAALVLGQPNGTSSAVASPPTSASMNAPYGVFGANGKLVVSDTGNNRVLVFESFAGLTIPAPLAITGTGAAFAIGQASLTTATTAVPPTASSLREPQGIFVSQNELWVADTGNHRVLRFNAFTSISSSGTAAGFVLGQPAFETRTANNTVSGSVDAFGLTTPAAVFTAGSDIIWVSDQGNNRVLFFSVPNP